LLDFFQITAIPFGGTALFNAQRGLPCQSPLGCDFFAQSLAVWRFFVKLLSNRCRASLITEGQDIDRAGDIPLPKFDGIAHFDFTGCFGSLRIDLDPAFAYFICGQGPGFVKTRRPEPFIDSDFVHKASFWANLSISGPNTAVFLPSSLVSGPQFVLAYGYNPEALPVGQPSVKDRTQQLIPNRLRKL
jgi:hypothetical protein